VEYAEIIMSIFVAKKKKKKWENNGCLGHSLKYGHNLYSGTSHVTTSLIPRVSHTVCIRELGRSLGTQLDSRITHLYDWVQWLLIQIKFQAC